jgi:hypothetical protein
LEEVNCTWERQFRHGVVSESYCFLECDIVWCVLTLVRFAAFIFKVEERKLMWQNLDIEIASLSAYAAWRLKSDGSRRELCA